MTLAELNEHLALVEKRNKAAELLESLRAMAHPGAQVLTGMPHAPGVKDKVGDLAVEIADLAARVEYMDELVRAGEEILQPFIDSIADDWIRTIFRLRFFRGLSWRDISVLIGGQNTEESVKMICYRYLGP